MLGLSQTYTMTVIACEPCKLQTIEDDDLQKVCEQHEGLRDALRERAKALDKERFEIVLAPVTGSDSHLSQRLLECGYDDSLPPAPVHQPMNSSFLGGGGATLPAGFADMVEKKTSEMLDAISIHAERSLTFEARLTDLDLRVSKMAKAQGEALAALHEQIGRVLKHVAPDTPRAPPLGRGAGAARARVMLTLVGRRIEAVTEKGAAQTRTCASCAAGRAVRGASAPRPTTSSRSRTRPTCCGRRASAVSRATRTGARSASTSTTSTRAARDTTRSCSSAGTGTASTSTPSSARPRRRCAS